MFVATAGIHLVGFAVVEDGVVVVVSVAGMN